MRHCLQLFVELATILSYTVLCPQTWSRPVVTSFRSKSPAVSVLSPKIALQIPFLPFVFFQLPCLQIARFTPVVPINRFAAPLQFIRIFKASDPEMNLDRVSQPLAKVYRPTAPSGLPPGVAFIADAVPLKRSRTADPSSEPRIVDDHRHPMAHLCSESKATNTSPISITQSAVAAVTLEDIQRFREASLQWVHKECEQASVRKDKAASPLETKAGPLPENPAEPYALYIVSQQNGATAICRPVHLELVANDRPDLNAAVLDKYSVDRFNSGHPNSQNYLEGDVIVVWSLRRSFAKAPKEFPIDMGQVNDLPDDPFWALNEFQVIERSMKPGLTSIVESFNGKKAVLLVSGLTEPATAKKKLLPELSEEGDLYRVRVFCPEVQAGQPLDSMEPEERRTALQLASDVIYPRKPFPTIVEVDSLTSNTEKYLEAFPVVFKEFPIDDAYRALLDAVRFGLSGALAAEKLHQDHRQYATPIHKVTATSRGTKIHLLLRTASGPAPFRPWSAGTKIQLDLRNGTKVIAEVEEARTEYQHLRIVARLPHFRSNLTVGSYITASNIIEDNAWQLDLLPSEHHFKRSPKKCNARKIIKALCEGTRIPHPPSFEACSVQLGNVTLTEAQSQYVIAVGSIDTPAVVANAAIGTGKTLMLAAAAVYSAQRHSWETDLHVVTSKTNIVAGKIADAIQHRFDPLRTIRAVRIISIENHQELAPHLRTSIDYPKLRIAEFRKFVRNNDCLLVPAVIYYLEQAGELPDDIHRGRIPSEKPDQSEMELFITIYKPKVIIGTYNSVLLHYKEFGTRNIVTVQVGEANLTPFHAVISLLGYFPTAKFAFVGDHRQLPPYCSPRLPDRLKEYAIGSILGALAESKAIPSWSVDVVWRCPLEITKTCSDLFYKDDGCEQGRLVARLKETANDHISYIQTLNLPSNFPIQVFDHSCEHDQYLNSITNVEEASKAICIADSISQAHPQTSIALLCYYKAQVSTVNRMLHAQDYHVGTIDAASGREWDVVIILTSRKQHFKVSEFLEEPSRLNVALSRAKSFCIVLVNTSTVGLSPIWEDFFNMLPSSAILGSFFSER